MKKTIGLIVICLLTGGMFAVVAASVNGQIGDDIIEKIQIVFTTNFGTALTIYTGLVAFIGAVVRVLLKRVPKALRGITSKIVWNILAGWFGDGVKLEKNTDIEYVKEQLKKKYPLLQIEIKKEQNKQNVPDLV